MARFVVKNKHRNGMSYNKIGLHPTLYNFNLHNVTHSTISQNPREQMFAVQISLLIVKFLALIS